MGNARNIARSYRIFSCVRSNAPIVLADRDGQTVYVVRQLHGIERDRSVASSQYIVEFPDGWQVTAYRAELSVDPVNT